MKYSRIVIGGTFDHLHTGHEAFISYACRYSSNIVIGLTQQSMLEHKPYKDTILPYSKREQELTQYMQKYHSDTLFNIVPINTIYGTADSDESLQAIVVTQDTLSGAEAINKRRLKSSKKVLDVIVCPITQDIHSSYVRQGIMDRTGFTYASLFTDPITLSSDQKAVLHTPNGEFIKSENISRLKAQKETVLVGDAVTEAFTRFALPFSISYCDGKTERKSYAIQKQKAYRYIHTQIENPSGTIQPNIFTHIGDHFIEQNTVYFILGEEDLVAVAAVLALPLGYHIYFGMPNQKGIMRFVITEELKQSVQSLLTL